MGTSLGAKGRRGYRYDCAVSSQKQQRRFGPLLALFGYVTLGLATRCVRADRLLLPPHLLPMRPHLSQTDKRGITFQSLPPADDVSQSRGTELLRRTRNGDYYCAVQARFKY